MYDKDGTNEATQSPSSSETPKRRRYRPRRLAVDIWSDLFNTPDQIEQAVRHAQEVRSNLITNMASWPEIPE